MAEQTIQNFIENKVTSLTQIIEKDGMAKVSTCNARNWCQKTYNTINKVSSLLKAKGYGSRMTTNWGVQDWEFYLK